MNPNEHFDKIVKTIKSCETLYHINSAIAIIELYDSRKALWHSFFKQEIEFPRIHHMAIYDHDRTIDFFNITIRNVKTNMMNCCGDWDSFGTCKCKS